MKLEIISPVQGKSWKVGHTVLISDPKVASKLIEDGLAKHHPTVTDPPPTHECPCKEHDEPCEECDDKVPAEKDDEDVVKPKRKTTRKKKTTPPKL
tara:strand:+ start:1026 stop:1313 length:288 start_codon:yes stop_codon:yes gene_type:complete